jgi:ATP-dependent DNA ligase
MLSHKYGIKYPSVSVKSAPTGSYSRVNKRAAALKKDPAQFVLFCFHILHLAGMNTRELPYAERHRLLLESVAPSELVQVVHADANGVAMYAALATGLEGVVGKRKASLYYPGARSHDWLKIKPVENRQAFDCGLPAEQDWTHKQAGCR